MAQLHDVEIEVNGKKYAGRVEARVSLAEFLRDAAELTGTHVGCEHGVCGACTVLLEGRSARACLLFAVQMNGQKVTTVEGLAAEGTLSPLQEAFIEHHALQCGFCTPGILMSLTELLDRHPGANEDAIRDTLSGHLCRCTGYAGIVDAARAAVSTMQERKP